MKTVSLILCIVPQSLQVSVYRPILQFLPKVVYNSPSHNGLLSSSHPSLSDHGRNTFVFFGKEKKHTHRNTYCEHKKIMPIHRTEREPKS